MVGLRLEGNLVLIDFYPLPAKKSQTPAGPQPKVYDVCDNIDRERCLKWGSNSFFHLSFPSAPQPAHSALRMEKSIRLQEPIAFLMATQKQICILKCLLAAIYSVASPGDGRVTPSRGRHPKEKNCG